jgi:hypothetical protein
MNDAIDHGALRSASATRSASTFSSTSCTRKTSAPFIRSKEVNATVGNSRWWIEPLCPEILPRKRLARHSNNKWATVNVQARQIFQQREIVRERFSEPDSRIERERHWINTEL